MTGRTNGKVGQGPAGAVFFDAAGTLIKLRYSVGESYSLWAREKGLDVSPEEIDRVFPMALEVMTARRSAGLEENHSGADESLWWQEVVNLSFMLAGKPVPGAPFRLLFELFSSGRAWSLYDGAQTVLQNLSRCGFRLGLVSNFDDRLEEILTNLEILDYFEVVVLSSNTGRLKPDPAVFLEGARRARLAPGEVLFIGDSYAEDYLGAREAGMNAVLLDRKHHFNIQARISHLREVEDHVTDNPEVDRVRFF